MEKQIKYIILVCLLLFGCNKTPQALKRYVEIDSKKGVKLFAFNKKKKTPLNAQKIVCTANIVEELWKEKISKKNLYLSEDLNVYLIPPKNFNNYCKDGPLVRGCVRSNTPNTIYLYSDMTNIIMAWIVTHELLHVAELDSNMPIESHENKKIWGGKGIKIYFSNNSLSSMFQGGKR